MDLVIYIAKNEIQCIVCFLLVAEKQRDRVSIIYGTFLKNHFKLELSIEEPLYYSTDQR